MSVTLDSIKIRSSGFGSLSNFVIYFTAFIDITGFGLIIPLVPGYVDYFGFSAIGLGILIASFSLMQFIFSPILGKISDRVGRRPILLLSISISCISFLIFSFALSYEMLFISRIIGGLATELSIAQAYIADTTSPKERGAKYGKLGSVFGAGFIAGPALASFLYSYGELINPGFGFTIAGLGAVSLTIINLAFVYFFLPESVSKIDLGSEKLLSNEKFNFKNSLNNPDKKIKNYFNEFYGALKNPVIGPVLLIYFIDSVAFSAIPVILPLIGDLFFLIGPAELGYVFVYIGIIQIVWQGLILGKLIGKFGENKLLIMGPFLMALGLFTMPFINNFIFFMFAVSMVSLGNGTNNTTVPSFISKRSNPKEQGEMLGIAQSWAAIGRVPGPLIGGSLFEFLFFTPFIASAGMLIVASGLAIDANTKDKKLTTSPTPSNMT